MMQASKDAFFHSSKARRTSLRIDVVLMPILRKYSARNKLYGNNIIPSSTQCLQYFAQTHNYSCCHIQSGELAIKMSLANGFLYFDNLENIFTDTRQDCICRRVLLQGPTQSAPKQVRWSCQELKLILNICNCEIATGEIQERSWFFFLLKFCFMLFKQVINVRKVRTENFELGQLFEGQLLLTC